MERSYGGGGLRYPCRYRRSSLFQRRREERPCRGKREGGVPWWPLAVPAVNRRTVLGRSDFGPHLNQRERSSNFPFAFPLRFSAHDDVVRSNNDAKVQIRSFHCMMPVSTSAFTHNALSIPSSVIPCCLHDF